MLIVFSGLPGTGKTMLARDLSRKLSALYLRIDTLEQAILTSCVLPDPGPAGYLIGYAVALDNLVLGSTVVADSVNPLTVTRDAWIDVAKKAEVPCFEIEVICADAAEHRRRVDSRKADIPGHKLPNWQEVLDRQYDPWKREHIVIDTAIVSVLQAVNEVIRQLPQTVSPKP